MVHGVFYLHYKNIVEWQKLMMLFSLDSFVMLLPKPICHPKNKCLQIFPIIPTFKSIFNIITQKILKSRFKEMVNFVQNYKENLKHIIDLIDENSLMNITNAIDDIENMGGDIYVLGNGGIDKRGQNR